jgi:hypothetical protein
VYQIYEEEWRVVPAIIVSLATQTDMAFHLSSSLGYNSLPLAVPLNGIIVGGTMVVIGMCPEIFLLGHPDKGGSIPGNITVQGIHNISLRRSIHLGHSSFPQDVHVIQVGIRGRGTTIGIIEYMEAEYSTAVTRIYQTDRDCIRDVG